MDVVTRGTEENPQYWAVDIYGKLHRVTNEAGKGFLLTAQQETADEMRAKNPKNNHNNRKVVEGDSDSAQPEGAPLPPPAPRPSLDEVFGAPVALKAPSPFEQVPSGPAKTTEQMRAEGYESWAMTEPATAAMVEELHVNDVFGVRSKADSLDALRASYQLETDAALARGETPRDFQSFVRELHDFRAKHAEVARVAAAAAPRPPEAAPAPASPSKTPEKIAEEARIAQLKGDIAIIIRKDIPTLLPKDVLDDPVMFEEALQSKFAAEASLLPAGTTYEQWLTATKYNFETFVDKAIHKSTEILSMGSINELLRGKDHDEIVAYYETYKQSCIDSGMSADDVPSLKRWLEDVQANEEANRVVESRLSPEQRAKFDRIVDLVLESKDPLLINTYKGMGREEIFDAVISQYGDTAGVSIGVLDGILDNNIMKLEESAASHSEKKEFEITDVFGEGHGSIGHERLLTRKRALALIGSLALGFAAQRHQGVHNMVSQLTYKTPLVPTVDLGQGISKWSNRLIQFNMYATPLYLGAIMSAQKMARPFARRKYAREMIESIDEGDVIVERAEDSSDAGFRRVVSVDKANPDGIIEFQILTEDLKVDDRYHYNEENRTIKMLLSDYQDMLRRKQNFGRFANLTKNEAHHGHSEGVHAKHLGEAERFIEEIIADGIKPEGLIHMGQPLVFDRYDAVTDTFSYIRQDRVRLTYERDELLHKLVRSIADEIVTNIEAVQEIPDLTRSQKVRRAVGNATASVRGLRPVSRARQGASRRMGELRTSFAQAFADRGEERKLRRQRVTDTIDHLRTGRQLYLGVDTGRVEFTKVARDRSGQIASATYRTESGKEVVITGTALRKRIEDTNRVSTRKTRYARVTGRVPKVVTRGAVKATRKAGRLTANGARRAQQSYRNRRGGPTPPAPLPPPMPPFGPPTSPSP
jgi:hypothetical protein